MTATEERCKRLEALVDQQEREIDRLLALLRTTRRQASALAGYAEIAQVAPELRGI